MRDFKEYLLIIHFLMIRSHTPAGMRLKVGFYKARFLALCFFFISMIYPRYQLRMLILPYL